MFGFEFDFEFAMEAELVTGKKEMYHYQRLILSGSLSVTFVLSVSHSCDYYSCGMS